MYIPHPAGRATSPSLQVQVPQLSPPPAPSAHHDSAETPAEAGGLSILVVSGDFIRGFWWFFGDWYRNIIGFIGTVGYLYGFIGAFWVFCLDLQGFKGYIMENHEVTMGMSWDMIVHICFWVGEWRYHGNLLDIMRKCWDGWTWGFTLWSSKIAMEKLLKVVIFHSCAILNYQDSIVLLIFSHVLYKPGGRGRGLYKIRFCMTQPTNGNLKKGKLWWYCRDIL